MKASAENFILEMSHAELWHTIFDLKRRIENTIDTHWVNHQNAWREHEKEFLHRLQAMANCIGKPHLYTDVLEYAEKKFKEFNSNTTKC